MEMLTGHRDTSKTSDVDSQPSEQRDETVDEAEVAVSKQGGIHCGGEDQISDDVTDVPKKEQTATECDKDDSVQDVSVDDMNGGNKPAHDAVETYSVPGGLDDSVVGSGVEMEPSDEEDIGDTSDLNAEERNELFARGLSREKDGKRDAALKCYIGCLAGLSKNTRFVLLPQCLRNIAEIYYQNQEYDKAIQFIQAEKLYYENALINTEEIQKKLEELNVGQGEQLSESSKPDARSVETLRAEEYEHLAKLCMDKQQPQLALEYAGKCTKLRQQLFGEQHPKTQESLDYFASLYAEVGKQQYNDSMETLGSPEQQESVSVVTDSDSSAPTTPTGDGTPVSILRHRKNRVFLSNTLWSPRHAPCNAEKEKKQVRFHESVVDNSHQQAREEWVSRTVLTVLLFFCGLFLTILGLGLYCRVVDTYICRSLVETAHSAYLQMRYQYYKYTSTKHVKFA